MKTIVLSRDATRDLDALPAAAQQQVVDALDNYVLHGRGDVKRLAGQRAFRLRSGRYRIIFEEDTLTVLAIYIGKRETTTYARN